MGKIELDHTGSGSGITLSSDGTSLLLDGTAIGGGGGGSPDLFAENYDGTSTLPSATGTNAVAIGLASVSSGLRSVAIGNLANASGLRGFAVGVNSAASGSNAISMGANSASSGSSSVAIGAETSAASSNSLALGYQAKTVTGSNATAIGYRAYASGTDSFAAAIANNTSSYGATGANSVALGKLAKASGTEAFAVGELCVASGTNSVAIGGTSTADATNAVSLGSFADNDGVGSRLSFGITGTISAQQQTSFFTSEKTTSDATPIEIGFNDTYRHKLKNNTAHAFSGTIVARQQASAGTASAAWKVEGLIRREGSAGTTVLVNSATTVLDNTPAWGMALSANTTRGGLAITVTGAASTNIRWVSTIHTTEVTYA